jgi:D-glycero-D-manno-heptose 1,7-bisphosphate phosphatase
MKRNILLDLLSEVEAGKKVDLDRELIPRLIEKGFTTKAVRNVGFIRDCGTPERLRFVNDNWNEIENKQFERPAIFIDRDGTINKLNGFITNLNQIEVFDDTASFVAQMNKINYWVIVVTNQPVIARGEVSTEMLDSFHAEIERIVIEGGGIIDDFFYCPHHPDSGFQGEILNLKINCGCRKPEIGMILEACKRYPIDLRNSWMIGDTWRDAELAKRAGIKFIKINPNESETEENQSAKSLSDAAKLILMSAGSI